MLHLPCGGLVEQLAASAPRRAELRSPNCAWLARQEEEAEAEVGGGASETRKAEAAEGYTAEAGLRHMVLASVEGIHFLRPGQGEWVRVSSYHI
eukprot:SAG11_NODE_4432_length_1896_cov_2.442404_2_plen_94_part_00